MDIEVNEESFASLAEKLEQLELSSGERVLLNAIIENANDDSDVGGFKMDVEGGFGMDNATWLLNQNITAPRVQLASKWTLMPPRG